MLETVRGANRCALAMAVRRFEYPRTCIDQTFLSFPKLPRCCLFTGSSRSPDLQRLCCLGAISANHLGGVILRAIKLFEIYRRASGARYSSLECSRLERESCVSSILSATFPGGEFGSPFGYIRRCFLRARILISTFSVAPGKMRNCCAAEKCNSRETASSAVPLLPRMASLSESPWLRP